MRGCDERRMEENFKRDLFSRIGILGANDDKKIERI